MNDVKPFVSTKNITNFFSLYNIIASFYVRYLIR